MIAYVFCNLLSFSWENSIYHEDSSSRVWILLMRRYDTTEIFSTWETTWRTVKNNTFSEKNHYFQIHTGAFVLRCKTAHKEHPELNGFLLRTKFFNAKVVILLCILLFKLNQISSHYANHYRIQDSRARMFSPFFTGQWAFGESG